ncbi:MAG: hypothetical protein FWG98_15730 [Candidatus Cloacimonetes bacterium]|nr:hypothetical protein [Candidatus Cloacimonadota bacterium]
MKKLMIFFFCMFCFSLGYTQTRTLISNQSWIENLQREFDERTYLTDQGSGSSTTEARDRAIQNLTERMIADVRTMRVTTRNISERNETQSGNRTDIVIRAQTHEGETNINTNVKLIGIEIRVSSIQDDGMYYAFVYMNRRQSADRYRDMINNNVSSIVSLIDDARNSMGQLLAIQRFREATDLAYETDMLYTIYGVLNPTVSISRPVYDTYLNATEVRIASDEVSRNFAIRVNVRGDVNNRIRSAITTAINNMGFNAIITGNALYLLEAELILEEAESTNPNFVFYRYVLNYTLRDNQGQIVFSDSDTGREGATIEANARETALRLAVRTIADSGFNEKFKEFLDE